MSPIPLTKDELLAFMEKHDKRLKRVYRISFATYVQMYDSQDGKCAICKYPRYWTPNGKLPLMVDHDHRTGKVRGLLCNRCNVGLGMFRDHPDRFHNAGLYLFGRPTRDIARKPRQRRKKPPQSERLQRRSEQERIQAFDHAIG